MLSWRRIGRAAAVTAGVLLLIGYFWLVLSAVPPHAGS